MFPRIAWFEFRHQLRQPLFWGSAFVFLALAFVATTTDALQLGGGIGSLNRNAPYVVVRMLGNLSLIGLFLVVAMVASAALRDFEQRTDEIVFASPVRLRDLLLGRFAGSLAAACACFSFASVGLLAGSLMPWLDPARVGPLNLRPHAYGLLFLAFPAFAILGALFFAVATRARSALATYVVLVALLVAYFTASAMFGDVESQPRAAWLDPFGLTAFELQTRYFTVAEKNTALPPLAGVVLWNRAAWSLLAAAVLAAAIATFRYERGRRRSRLVGAPTDRLVSPGPWLRERPASSAAFSWAKLASTFRLEARALVLGVPFLLILAFGITNVLANMGYLELMLGTPVWPVTYLMLLAVSAGYAFLLMLILALFAGDAVWRERRHRIDEVLDASPVSSWAPLLAKLGALFATAAVFILAGMVALMGYQLFHGYTHLEPLLYAQGLVVELVPYLLVGVLALFLQVAMGNRFVGYLLFVLYLVSISALSALHFDHFLYRYAGAPGATYSDLNGWGHFAKPLFWFELYWSFAAGVLVCLAYAMWPRGSERGVRVRLRQARERLRGRAGWAAAALLLACAGVGGFIFYNTNVLNRYVPSDEGERLAADYEKLYRQHRDLPQPRIVAIRTDVDIYPSERRAVLRGEYRLVNRTGMAIPDLHVGVPPWVREQSLSIGRANEVVTNDRNLGYAIYKLKAPLQPGEETTLRFDLALENPGFKANAPNNAVLENGTFLDSRAFPSLGYLDYRELTDPSERRRQGLPDAAGTAKIDDLAARGNNDLARDADWLSFETTISTSPDQIAIAPGYLEREWTKDGRRYFHYAMDSPIPRFFAYQSARYTVAQDAWKDVAIQVFHHPGHEYNVPRMVDAVKKSLDYLTTNFSPYQHRQVRIVEFPRYTRRAASFPNTLPFSESIGFIARVDGPDAIDTPFYVTAHEVAHQWWGYQVLGADVQGSAMLSETMAQYSALMIARKEFGDARMRRFLRYELDGYLSGRGSEVREETPLALVENQGYIHYRKGSLVLFALQDYLGEDRLNAALRDYIQEVRFAPPPYTVSHDLLAHVAKIVPAEQPHLLEDLFSTITLYDLAATEATSRPLPDGKYEVTVKGRARKLRADGKGVESEIPIDDWIDVGILADRDADGGEPALYLRKEHVTGPEIAVTVVVGGAPRRAGIDPYNKLIDRTPSDNVRAVVAR